MAGARKVDGIYHMEIADVIAPRTMPTIRDAVKLITQRFTSALETMVRKAPEQYFWVHRRWKHQPLPAGTKKLAA